MPIRVVFNHFGAVAEALPRRIDSEVQDLAAAMTRELKATLWIRTGLVRQVTTVSDDSVAGHAEVDVGYNRGHGFYSRFQEWGTVKQAARPIVGPTAHAYEPRFAEEMGQAVSEACDAQ